MRGRTHSTESASAISAISATSAGATPGLAHLSAANATPTKERVEIADLAAPRAGGSLTPTSIGLGQFHQLASDPCRRRSRATVNHLGVKSSASALDVLQVDAAKKSALVDER
jgi:hypothetical protein